MNFEKYKRNAQEIKDILLNHPDFIPTMAVFCDAEGPKEYVKECGTQFCLAGYQAKLEDYPEEYLYSNGDFYYYEYSFDKIDVKYRDPYWDFTYGASNPDCRDHAIKRMNAVLNCESEEELTALVFAYHRTGELKCQ